MDDRWGCAIGRGLGLDGEGLVARSPLAYKFLCDFRQRAGRVHLVL